MTMLGNRASLDAAAMPQLAVQEKSFDEYHIYTLERPATLHDHEAKQVEFVRTSGVQSKRLYIYDGLKIGPQYNAYQAGDIRTNESYGTECDTKVAVAREFKNSEANHLGIPLPKGRVRFYRQDEDGQLEFTGENIIDHTPKDELIRIYTGNAFDLVGERKRTNWKSNPSDGWADESFEIKVRNHKKEPVEIRMIEHLYRGTNWEIRQHSNTFLKTNAQAVEFNIPLKPDEEQTVTYTVHYWW
jgi:hypothetical protein